MLKRCTLTLIGALTISWCSLAQSPGRVDITDWPAGDLERWNVKSFSGNTTYAIETADANQVLSAVAEGSASGLFLEKEIDLTKTPWLTWSWKVTEGLPRLNERSKAGDDYAARVYVVVSGGAFFWNTRALNYVWSGSQPSGATWPNAFTDNARMVAVRGDRDETGQWVTERRNVLEDLQKAFGEPITRIDAIAIMTDADNSGGRAAAQYGAIRFEAK